MRPPHRQARDLLRSALARQPGMAAAELAAQLGVSVPTLHRMLQEQAADIVAAGRARRARYAVRRGLRGSLATLPLYEVRADGRAAQVAELALVHPQGSCLSLQGSHWPLPEESRDGWWAGLPYPLVDMRPQGYLGRQLALAESRRLGVPPNPEAWSDDDVVFALAQVGSDTPGSLILGQVAFEHWQQRKLQAEEPAAGARTAPHYAALAGQAVAQGVPGSSAGGEFPKFPALRSLAGSGTPHVLVKFSGADNSPAVQRWADLLVCEHLALECVRTLEGVDAARTRIVRHAGRTFLEVERFDRHGLFGRSPIVSLGTIDAALLGTGASDWREPANRLHAAGWLGEPDRLAVHRLWWFGRLIANSDMHSGNLSFRPVAGVTAAQAQAEAEAAPSGHRATRLARTTPGALAVAPAYDMLPMLHAPLRGGELPMRAFEPPLPLPSEQAVWSSACAAALRFWHLAAADPRISAGFRALCAASAARLAAVAEHL